MKTISSSQMREIEQITINEIGIPSILLMENAAVRVVEHCLEMLKEIEAPRVLVACGQGNNGGDGLAAARLLHIKGIDTNVIFIGSADAVSADAAVNLNSVQKLKIPLTILPADDQYKISSDSEIFSQNKFQQYDLIVDAVFGTGLTRNVEGNYKILIDGINRYAKLVISADIPSGVHSDTGRIMGTAVKAARTVTFGFPKTGLYLFPGAENAGKIYIEDISIPRSLIERIDSKIDFLTESEAAEQLPFRGRRSNKGSFGKALIFAGSDEMPGAASLACSAAYMTGAGLVCACVTRNTASVIRHFQREIVTRIVPDKNGMFCKESLGELSEEIKNAVCCEISGAGAVVIGPGLGRGPDVTEFVFELLKMIEAASSAKTPVVLDADALFAISENPDFLKTLTTPCVITPHPGEMSRLTGLSVSEILDDITGTAEKFAKEYNVIVLLKDAHTVIASPDGSVNINTTGNSALSKAGTGDVLTGMIAGFISQGCGAFTSCNLGVYFHGKAGEAACIDESKYSVTASDVIDFIPIVMKKDF